MDEESLPKKNKFGHILEEGKEGDQKQDRKETYSEL
jgi:hypothetical protein